MIDVGGSMMVLVGLGVDLVLLVFCRCFCFEFGMVGGEKMLGGVIWVVCVVLVDSVGD